MKNDKQKRAFLNAMETLYDNPNVQIKISVEAHHKPSATTKEITATIKRFVSKKIYPFDIDLVAVKDMLNVPDFAGLNPHLIGRALKEAGCIKIEKNVYDDIYTRTRLWAARRIQYYQQLKPTQLRSIWLREEDRPPETSDVGIRFGAGLKKR